MNILLIYPKFPDTFWSFNHAVSFIGQKAAFPPLGLLTVAALLPQKWSKRLVDTNVERLRETDLLWADMVFIGGMTVQRESACRINVDGTTNILPRMGMEALSKGYQRIMEQIYSPSSYYRRVWTQLRALAPPRGVPAPGLPAISLFFQGRSQAGYPGKRAVLLLAADPVDPP